MIGIRAELPALCLRCHLLAWGLCNPWGLWAWGVWTPSWPSVQTVKLVSLQVGAELGVQLHGATAHRGVRSTHHHLAASEPVQIGDRAVTGPFQQSGKFWVGDSLGNWWLGIVSV